MPAIEMERKMTKMKMTAAEFYRLAQAQTLIDLHANGIPSDRICAAQIWRDSFFEAGACRGQRLRGWGKSKFITASQGDGRLDDNDQDDFQRAEQERDDCRTDRGFARH